MTTYVGCAPSGSSARSAGATGTADPQGEAEGEVLSYLPARGGGDRIAALSDAEFAALRDRLPDDIFVFNEALAALTEQEYQSFRSRLGLASASGASAASVVGASAAAFFTELGLQAADLAADEVPYLGQAKAATEALSGYNVRGEEIGVLGRIGAGLSMIPGVGVAKKVAEGLAGLGASAGKAAAAVVSAAKRADDVADAGRFARAKNAATSLKRGTFSISNWSGYPRGVPKPSGPFRLLSGAEYDAARKAANQANAALRRADPAKYAGKQIHEIHPVKFGGSPTDPANKIALPPQEHYRLNTWWDRLKRNIQD